MRNPTPSSRSLLGFFFFFFICVSLSTLYTSASASASASADDPCNPNLLPPPHLLHPNKLTVLLSGFSEARLPLLRSLAITYSSHPLVTSVQIVWSNPRTRAETLNRFLEPFPLHLSPTTSLNSRFLPRPSILTRAVAVSDDDVQIPPEALSFAFSVFNSQPERLVGFFPRSHDLDLGRRQWIYTVHPDRYSIVLTKFLIMGTKYFYQYSCGGGEKMRKLRMVVDEKRNCEDILMNFVVANRTRSGPILVGEKGVRDWGDVRNQQEEDGKGNKKENLERGGKEGEDLNVRVREVGLSKREGHWKMRGECIREFHKVMGQMPLRYSYGKVVEGVGEQSLCLKGGRLVACDEQVGD